MKAILVNYNYTPEWLKDSDLDYLIYDRSDGDNYLKDFPQERIIKTENIGNVDYDKLSYLVENYDTLPYVFLWGKTNIFKYVAPEDLEKALQNKVFAPLLKYDHKTYSDSVSQVCYYRAGMYYERNDSWYLAEHPAHHYQSYGDFAKDFNLPNPQYLPFPPGGNYILTREKVQSYARDFYDNLRSILPYTQLPGEAHMLERSYQTIWS